MSDLKAKSGQLIADRFELLEPFVPSAPGAESWVARDVVLSRKVRAILVDAPNTKEVLDAAKRAALVKDPHLVAIVQVVEGEQPAIITEIPPGTALSARLNGTVLPADCVHSIVGFIATAVTSGARRGVRHLQVRESNIFITDEGEVSLDGLGVDAALVRADLNKDPAALDRDEARGLTVLLAALSLGEPFPAPQDHDATIVRALELELPDAVRTVLERERNWDGAPSPADLTRQLAPWDDVRVALLPPAVSLPIPSFQRIDDDAPDLSDISDQSEELAAAQAGIIDAPELGESEPASAGDAVSEEDAAGIDTSEPSTPDPDGSNKTADLASEAAVTSDAVGLDALGLNLKGVPEVDLHPQWPNPYSATDAEDARDVEDNDHTETHDADSDVTQTLPDADGSAENDADNAADYDSSPLASSTEEAVALIDAELGIKEHPVPPNFSWPARSPEPAVTSESEAVPTSESDAAPTSEFKDAPASDLPSAPVPAQAPSAAPAPTPTPAPEPISRRTLAKLRTLRKPADGDSQASNEARSAVVGPNRETRFNPTRIIVAFFLVAMLIFGALAVGALVSPFKNAKLLDELPAVSALTNSGKDSEQAGESDASPSEEPVPSTPPVITGATLVNPDAALIASSDPAKQDNPGQTVKAVDGDPATAWSTWTYTSASMKPKSGTGLNIQLAEEATVTEVVIDAGGAGGNVQIRDTVPKAPASGKVVAEGPVNGQTTFTLAEPLRAASFVVWITELPQNPAGENQMIINEITVR